MLFYIIVNNRDKEIIVINNYSEYDTAVESLGSSKYSDFFSITTLNKTELLNMLHVLKADNERNRYKNHNLVIDFNLSSLVY